MNWGIRGLPLLLHTLCSTAKAKLSVSYTQDHSLFGSPRENILVLEWNWSLTPSTRKDGESETLLDLLSSFSDQVCSPAHAFLHFLPHVLYHETKKPKVISQICHKYVVNRSGQKTFPLNFHTWCDCEHPCHSNTHSDPMILALCPRQCACDNEKLVTECLGQPMGTVPFTLNPHLTVLKAVDVQLKGF